MSKKVLLVLPNRWINALLVGSFLLLSSCTPYIRDTRDTLQGIIPASAPVPPGEQFMDPPLPTPIPETINGPVTVALNLPENLRVRLQTALAQTPTLAASNGPQPLSVVEQTTTATTQIRLSWLPFSSHTLAERYFAVVVPFNTVMDNIPLAELEARWQGTDAQPLLVTPDAAELLPALLGATTAQIVAPAQLGTLLESRPGAVGIIAFDQLDPRLKVLTVDGVNVLDNRLDTERYPLAVAVSVEGVGASLLQPLLQPPMRPYSNRAASQLTTLIMTGVTAMARATAAKMEQKGVLYPAAIISNTLAAADITHISNEIPFLEDCVVNNTENNLTLCSHTSYWATLEAVGTDIVGLSGNHVNDFGRTGARESLTFYHDHHIPIYGSGFTPAEACAPLLWEDHGNTFAFFAALAFDPPSAWVTDTEPGACYWYEHKANLLDEIKQLAQTVDVVAVELQYEETYNPYPIASQVAEFREVREAGATIVTGVQSHVPQAMEPYGRGDAGGPGIISYGLGNLFFDQMWSWDTRTELIARHTIYQGHVISTEILTAVLEDFAQPRWATPDERAELLLSIFAGEPARP